MRFQRAEFSAQLQRRLLRGEHLTLYGPRGSGKSTVLGELDVRVRQEGVACAYSPLTTSLEHITCALEQAYPDVNTLRVNRRTARARLWRAADEKMGVLLLDHFRCSGNAMTSFLWRLHGKVAGVLSVVDIEDEAQRVRMRPWRYGAMSVLMPPMSTRQLYQLFDSSWQAARLPPLERRSRAILVAASRGRPGWVGACAALAAEPCYWSVHGLRVTVLSVDTDAAVRHGALALVRPRTRAASSSPVDPQASSLNVGGSVASGLMTPK